MSRYEGHTPGDWRAAPQPGQTVGVHTYTHCVMCGDDSIADTLTEPDARLIADAPLLLRQRDALLAAAKELVGDYEKSASGYPQNPYHKHEAAIKAAIADCERNEQ